MKTLLDDKMEIIKKWSSDPCGGIAGIEVGTPEYYASVDRERYDKYAPWMHKVMQFDQFEGKRLLEVGYGQGTDLFQFAKNGAIVSGIDLTPRHYELARRRFELAGIPADLRVGDAETMPFADGTFDAVYSFGVIHHSPDTQKIIDEINRVLKPGGRAIIGVYHKWAVFNIVNILLIQYLVKLRFLRESFRKTISRIEEGQHGEACPLVKTYSKTQLRKMLSRFRSTQMIITHLQHGDFSVFRSVVPNGLLPRLEPHVGWYLIARCVK